MAVCAVSQCDLAHSKPQHSTALSSLFSCRTRVLLTAGTAMHWTLSCCRYWMYAAVKAGRDGLLISNDEMRDHIFQLLAPKFFYKWKQVRLMHFPAFANTQAACQS